MQYTLFRFDIFVRAIVLITKHSYKISTRFIQKNERYNRVNIAKWVFMWTTLSEHWLAETRTWDHAWFDESLCAFDRPIMNINEWSTLILVWSCKIIEHFVFVAPFFVNCISEQDLDEMNIEIIRNTLYKVTFTNSFLRVLSGILMSKIQISKRFEFMFLETENLSKAKGQPWALFTGWNFFGSREVKPVVERSPVNQVKNPRFHLGHYYVRLHPQLPPRVAAVIHRWASCIKLLSTRFVVKWQLTLHEIYVSDWLTLVTILYY